MSYSFGKLMMDGWIDGTDGFRLGTYLIYTEGNCVGMATVGMSDIDTAIISF